MWLSYCDTSKYMLYFLGAIVLSTSTESLKSVDDVSSPENQNSGGGNRQGNHHTRNWKAVLINESLPLPGHDMTTGASTVSLSTVTANSTTQPLASSTISNASSTSASTPTSGFHPITPPSINDTCQFLLELYGRLVSRLTNCAIVHAKPFLFCENCVWDYVASLEAYDRISLEEHHNCKEELLSSDRVQIVNQLHNFVQNLWDDGNCDTCFEDASTCHYNKTCNLSPETRSFMESYRKTMDCFDDYKLPGVPETVLYSVCKNCSKYYQDLNEKYEESGPLAEICMDVVELMNHTRIKWSSEFECIQFQRDVGSVIALGGFIGSLPIFFYCGVRVHAVKQERKVMKQKKIDPCDFLYN